jgi:hypothetical protein
VTRDFGQRLLATAKVRKVRQDETVMRLLQSRFHVKTRYGGRFVQAIDGLAGKGAGGQVDWFYFVNGIEADVGAAEYSLSPGDVVQWDYRRWDAAMRVPAIVGAYPEPFVHGRKGRRYPVRVECADDSSRACVLVKGRLRALGVSATGASLGAAGTRHVLRVIVAPWRQAKVIPAVSALDEGPQRSGVFARVAKGGRALQLLGPGGEVVRTAPPGTGLVAALSRSEDELVWLVTGLTEQGVDAAAGALRRADLLDAYAVAVVRGGPVKLPLEGST